MTQSDFTNPFGNVGIGGTPVDPSGPGGTLIDPTTEIDCSGMVLNDVILGDGAGGCTTGPVPAGSILPVDDTISLVQDPADNTKQARIDAGAVATSTVRTIIMPDQDVDLAVLIAGLAGFDFKNSVETVATSNITLSGEQTINGVLTSGSRVGVVGQTLGEENGIYDTAAGAWTRATDADGSPSNEITQGMAFWVGNTPSTKNGFQYILTTPNPITVGTTPLSFTEVKRIELGTTSGTATEGNDSRVPTQDENDALVGTDGTPSSTNKYVTDSDSRHSRLLLEFRTDAGVPTLGTRYLERAGIAVTSVPEFLPAAASLIGITVGVDGAAGSGRNYEIRVISDPGGTDTLIGTALTLNDPAKFNDRRDLNAPIGAGTKWGVVVVRTAGSGPSNFSELRVEIEVRMP